MTKLLGFTLLSVLVLSGLTIANGATFNNNYDHDYDYEYGKTETPINDDVFVSEPMQVERFANAPDQVLDNDEANNRNKLLEELLQHEVQPDTLDPYISELNAQSFFPWNDVEDPDSIN